MVEYAPRRAQDEELRTPAAYFLAALTVPDAHTAIAQRARREAHEVGDDLAGYCRRLQEQALAVLGETEHGNPIIPSRAGALRLDTFLETRVFELTVHSLDIAAATGINTHLSDGGVRRTLRIACDLALARGIAPTVIRATLGRVPLPSGFSLI